MIQFRCACGQTLAAQDQDAGKATVCPKCNSRVSIPSSSAIQSDQPATAAPGAQAGRQDISAGEPQAGRARDFGDRPRRRDEKPPTSGAAMTAMILGLVSFCVPVLLSIPAIVLGLMGMAATGAGKGKSGRGLAITGIITGFFSLLCCTPILGLGGFFGYQGITNSAAKIQSQNNLKMIGVAMHSHHDIHQGLPPHAITGKNGEPLLSWRVMILPFIEQDNLYRQFKLDEPWDSPNNKRLLTQMPKVFAHPLKMEDGKKGLTYYQVFVGQPNERPQPVFVRPDPRNKFNKLRGATLTQIRDGMSNTFMVVEASTPVYWTKPDDIPYEPNQPLPKLGLFSGGFNALLCDGSVFFIDRSRTNEQNLRALITRDDGQPVNIPRR